jgi:hypothetical protein
MIADNLKYIPINQALDMLNKALLEKPESPLYRSVYGEVKDRKIFTPNTFNDFFRLKHSSTIPVLNLGKIEVRGLEEKLRIANAEGIRRMNSVSREIGKSYLSIGVPKKFFQKNIIEDIEHQ